jgi:spore coat protein H
LKNFPQLLRIYVLLLLSGVLLQACYKEQIIVDYKGMSLPGHVLKFDQVPAFADKQENIILYTLPSDTIVSFSPHVTFADYQSISINGKELIKNEINDLGEVLVNQPYRLVAKSKSETEYYQLCFTKLPILHISTEKTIKDEPKVLSWFELQYALKDELADETCFYSSNAGIEIRGRTSANHEKKSYGLELWKDCYKNDSSASLLGMHSCEDWILDAMYIDPLRMRNKLSFELWGKMCSHGEVSPWKTPDPGIRSEYIELFINQNYMGLYTLSERLDETLLNLYKGPEGFEGLIYKAIGNGIVSSIYETYNDKPGESMIWEGWEQVFPDQLACWQPLLELRNTLLSEDDEFFRENIESLLNLDCAAEYYIFVNMLLAYDNIVKNHYLIRYPYESQFLMHPWDLEATWGIMWDGRESKSTGIVENRLFKHLIALEVAEFTGLLESKWEHYRESFLQTDSLLASALVYADLLKESGVIERENARWPAAEMDLDYQIRYLSDWTSARLEYLDRVFD